MTPNLAFYVAGWVALSGAIAVVFWAIAAFHTYKLTRRLKSSDYAKWRGLTSVGRFGPGLSNPLLLWDYLQVEEDVHDNESLVRMKDRTRISWRYFFVWLLTFGASLLIGAIIITLVKQR